MVLWFYPCESLLMWDIQQLWKICKERLCSLASFHQLHFSTLKDQLWVSMSIASLTYSERGNDLLILQAPDQPLIFSIALTISHICLLPIQLSHCAFGRKGRTTGMTLPWFVTLLVLAFFIFLNITFPFIGSSTSLLKAWWNTFSAAD